MEFYLKNMLIKNCVNTNNEQLVEMILETLTEIIFVKKNAIEYMKKTNFIINSGDTVNLNIKDFHELMENSERLFMLDNIPDFFKNLDDIQNQLNEFNNLFMRSLGNGIEENKEGENNVIGNEPSEDYLIDINNKGYLKLIEFLKMIAPVKILASEIISQIGVNPNGEETANIVFKTIENCNDILIKYCKSNTQSKKKLLKNIQIIALLPLPKQRDKGRNPDLDNYKKRILKDIELIKEICRDNNEIAYMRRAQIDYFMNLTTILNYCLDDFNYEDILEIFTNIVDKTLHKELSRHISKCMWQYIQDILAYNLN